MLYYTHNNINEENEMSNYDSCVLPTTIVKYDIQERDKKYKHTHSAACNELALKIYSMASMVFERSEVFLNYRKHFIVIKVNAPTKADKMSTEYDKFVFFYEKYDINPIVTRNGILYRIKE